MSPIVSHHTKSTTEQSDCHLPVALSHVEMELFGPESSQQRFYHYLNVSPVVTASARRKWGEGRKTKNKAKKSKLPESLFWSCSPRNSGPIGE